FEVTVILRQVDNVLEFGKAVEQLEGGGARIAVVLGALIAPGVVAEAGERHDQADEGDRVLTQLLPEGLHGARIIRAAAGTGSGRGAQSPAGTAEDDRGHPTPAAAASAQRCGTLRRIQLTGLLPARVRNAGRDRARHRDQAHLRAGRAVRWLSGAHRPTVATRY